MRWAYVRGRVRTGTVLFWASFPDGVPVQISVSECVVFSGNCSGERQKESPVKSDSNYLEDNSSADKEASFLYIFHLYHAMNRTESTDTALSLGTSNFSLCQPSLLGALCNQQ